MNKIITVEHLSKMYLHTKAIDDISFDVKEGEVLGIVGQSGSGKSTLARILSRLESKSVGQIAVNHKAIDTWPRKQYFQQLQMLFQDSRSTFDPKMTIQVSFEECLKNYRYPKNKWQEIIKTTLDFVKIDYHLLKHYPHQLSGGQCQRLALARILMIQPQILILDEPTSAIDALSQKQVIQLLKTIHVKTKMTMIVISHDIALIQALCQNVLVMYQGQIVERGTIENIICQPQHLYTRQLIASVI